MNVKTLQQLMSQDIHVVRSAIDYVFCQTIARVKKTNRKVNIKRFVDQLNTALIDTNIKVYSEIDNSMGQPLDNIFYPIIGAFCFQPKDKSIPAKIKIIICTHSSTNRLSLSVDTWEYFKFRFLKVALHELVHRAQYAMGRKEENVLIFKPMVGDTENNKKYEEQKYLGDIDEIESYAYDCVQEWHYFYPNKKLSLPNLKNEFNGSTILPSLEFYHEIFETIDSIVVRRLFKKVMEWEDCVTPISQFLPKCPWTNKELKKLVGSKNSTNN